MKTQHKYNAGTGTQSQKTPRKGISADCFPWSKIGMRNS